MIRRHAASDGQTGPHKVIGYTSVAGAPVAGVWAATVACQLSRLSPLMKRRQLNFL